MSFAPTRQPLLGAAALVFSTLLYGFFGILTRMAGFTLPLFFMTWVRNLVVAVLILGPLIWLGKFKLPKPVDLIWLIARTTSGVIAFVSSYYALLFTHWYGLFYVFWRLNFRGVYFG
jgi:drug/metabolite transporter (DMT)-like permease